MSDLGDLTPEPLDGFGKVGGNVRGQLGHRLLKRGQDGVGGGGPDGGRGARRVVRANERQLPDKDRQACGRGGGG